MPLPLALARGEKALAGVRLRGVIVVGEELRHFWRGLCGSMPVACGHGPLGKHAKIGVQDMASSNLFQLLQKCNRHFDGGQVLGTALAAQAIRRRSPGLNGHPGNPLQIWTPV